MEKEPSILDVNVKQKCVYAIPLWLRDLQIKAAIQRTKRRLGDDLEPGAQYPLRNEPIAVVCFGPSLNQTWEKIRDFKYRITCSGAHKFLSERGIIPTWHLDVDPREHKALLIGKPNVETKYLIASTCHPKLFDHLEGFEVILWHIFADEDEAARTLPRGEWALTGGASAGLRAMSMARFLGFTQLEIFGMDGNEGPTGKHADKHPNQAKDHSLCNYEGIEYRTTPAILECARETFRELDAMPDVKATFHGEGLVQSMAKKYEPKPRSKMILAFSRPELISPEYRELNTRLHRQEPKYGVSGQKRAATVLKIAESMKTQSLLDYGCGKGLLAKNIPFPIWEYDPCIPGKSELPRPAELVVCTDVLEHVEPEKLLFVLEDLKRCVLKVGYFVINTKPAAKTYANGENTHLIQKPREWWEKQLGKFFTIAKTEVAGDELHIVVGPQTANINGQGPRITEIKNGSLVCKFYTPNDATKWRADTVLAKEPVTTRWLNSLPVGEVFFDVGANMGGYSVLAGTRGVRVFAFEPESENYAILVKNLELNGLEPSAYCVALSDKPGLGSLKISQPGAGGSCHEFREVAKGQGCYAVTLDEIVATKVIPSPDHIKIDVDGLEWRVIKGAQQTLRNGVKSVLVEVNAQDKNHLDMVRSIQEMGFEYDPVQVADSTRTEGAFKGVAEYLFRKSIVKATFEPTIDFTRAMLHEKPFKWLYLENVFPTDFYSELRARLPADYTPIADSRGVHGYPQRFTAAPTDPFWTSLFARLRNGRLKRQLCDIFGVGNPDLLKDECLLIRDIAGYHIGPHTDSPAKVITVLFYLPPDESLTGAGTSIYEPLKPGFTCEGGPHYPASDFRIVETMAFKPNSAFAFLKSNNSFHGVEPCTGTRDVLLYDIRV